MRPIFPLGTALAALGLACSGGSGGPTAIEIAVAGIEVTEPCTVVIEGENCQIGVRATAEDGRVIQNPVLRYISTNSSAADVTEAGLVIGRAAGSGTIFVTNSTGSVTDDFRFNVLPRNAPK
jgi:hypothetical protein